MLGQRADNRRWLVGWTANDVGDSGRRNVGRSFVTCRSGAPTSPAAGWQQDAAPGFTPSVESIVIQNLDGRYVQPYPKTETQSLPRIGTAGARARYGGSRVSMKIPSGPVSEMPRCNSFSRLPSRKPRTMWRPYRELAGDLTGPATGRRR